METRRVDDLEEKVEFVDYEKQAPVRYIPSWFNLKPTETKHKKKMKKKSRKINRGKK